MPGEGIMRPLLLLLLSIGAAHAEPSIAERIAHATYVPSPSALPSMPSVEWCDVVDAALANPNTNQARREENIATGQTMKCAYQLFSERRKGVQEPQTRSNGAPKRSRRWAIGSPIRI